MPPRSGGRRGSKAGIARPEIKGEAPDFDFRVAAVIVHAIRNHEDGFCLMGPARLSLASIRRQFRPRYFFAGNQDNAFRRTRALTDASLVVRKQFGSLRAKTPRTRRVRQFATCAEVPKKFKSK